jgi:hypothetical protein
MFEPYLGNKFVKLGINIQISVISSYLKEKFKKQTPQSPIRALTMLKPNSKIKIEYVQNETDIEAKLRVDNDEFVAKSVNKRHVKEIVYRLDVKKYDVLNKVVFF